MKVNLSLRSSLNFSRESFDFASEKDQLSAVGLSSFKQTARIVGRVVYLTLGLFTFPLVSCDGFLAGGTTDPSSRFLEG